MESDDADMTSPSNASVSTRSYIYSLPYPIPTGTPVPYTLGLPKQNPLKLPDHAFEPTNTLVLTTPSKAFIDVRFYKPIKPGDPDLPNDGGSHERLEWAFAGRSSSVTIPDPYSVETGGSWPAEGERLWAGDVKKASWTHWIDSKYPIGTPELLIPKDEGVMYPISSTQTLEHGSASNPHTNKMHSYEEMWADLRILPTYPSTNFISILLRLDATAQGARGVIIRLGQYCQGILMKDDYCTIERWQFEEKQDKEGMIVGGEWKRVARIGDQFLPCATTFKPEICVLGGTVKYFGYDWVVEEKVEWADRA